MSKYKLMKRRLLTIATHTVAWVIFLIIVPLMPMRPGESFNLINMLPFVFAYIYLLLFFYLNVYVLIPRLVSKRKYLLYGVCIFIGFVSFMVIQRVVWNETRSNFEHKFSHRKPFDREGTFADYNETFKDRMPPREMKDMPRGDLEPDNSQSRIHIVPNRNGSNMPFEFRLITLPFFQFLMFFLLSIGYRISLEWFSINQRNKEIEAEKLKAELSFLKAQINPHFFFNTLNTIYALSLNKSDKATDAILVFSQLVRYVLNKAEQDTVPLSEEIVYLSDYIDLQKLRFSENLKVEFNVSGDIEKYTIAPLLIMTFVENAFQYGVSTHYISDIIINLSAKAGIIHFDITNKIYKTQKQVGAGSQSIGIGNTTKKLDLIYPDNYTLNIMNDGYEYRVDLDINVGYNQTAQDRIS